MHMPSRRCRRRARRAEDVITHAVVDIDRWLMGKVERAALIGAFATNVVDRGQLGQHGVPRSVPASRSRQW